LIAKDRVDFLSVNIVLMEEEREEELEEEGVNDE
jgi:hypothetical protein